MAYDRQWLRDQVASYLHDAATSPLLDTWIDIGAKRVSSVLRCWEMESELSVGLAVVTELGVADGGSASGGGTIIDGGDAFAGQVQQDSFITLPAGVQDILGVQWQNNSGEWINLTALSKHEAGPYKRSGAPSHYLIENRRIYPYPIADGNYKAQSVSEVVIPPGADDVVPALASYPFVFLSAALTEAYDWKQDDKMYQRYEQKWFTEATTIANNYRQERTGETLAQRAV